MMDNELRSTLHGLQCVAMLPAVKRLPERQCINRAQRYIDGDPLCTIHAKKRAKPVK